MRQPNLFSRIMYGWRVAVQAFRESSLVSDVFTDENFSDYEVRKLRYSIYWAMYENTAYSDVHSWAKAFKSTFGLYRFIRSIYNPAAELIDFWSDSLMGGVLDRDAGDGILEPSALPIIMPGEEENPVLRKAISKIWADSNWQVHKDIYTAWGAALGDVFIKPIVRPKEEMAYMKLIHPAFVKDVDMDDQGNVTGYLIERSLPEPENGRTFVRYNEEVEKKGDKVTYKTFLNGKPYAWDGNQAEWSYEYGFVPLVKVQHSNVGSQWGWGEFHKHRTKFTEVDDLASVMHDQIRKLVNPVWIMKGMTAPKSGRITTSHTSPTYDDPQSDREESNAIFAGEKADAIPMTTNVNLDDVAAEILNVLKAIESAYPELRKEVQAVGGEASGKAIREMRRAAENKVIKKRISYDHGLVEAHKMTIALAGFHEIPDFSGFGVEDYKGPKLEHHIGQRKVYDADPLDDAEFEKMFWQAANEAERSGVHLPVYLERQGWSPENIEKVKEGTAYKAKETTYEAMIAMNEEAIKNPLGDPSAISQNGPIAGLNKNQLKPKEQNQTDKVGEAGFQRRDEDGTSKDTEKKRQSISND